MSKKIHVNADTLRATSVSLHKAEVETEETTSLFVTRLKELSRDQAGRSGTYVSLDEFATGMRAHLQLSADVFRNLSSWMKHAADKYDQTDHNAANGMNGGSNAGDGGGGGGGQGGVGGDGGQATPPPVPPPPAPTTDNGPDGPDTGPPPAPVDPSSSSS
jgi:hypothetical protein